jgi:hypothetical protein
MQIALQEQIDQFRNGCSWSYGDNLGRHDVGDRRCWHVAGRPVGVLDDLDVFECDGAAADKFADSGQQASDTFGTVDPLEDHRQVGRKVGQPRGVQPAVGAEAGQAAEHGCSGRAFGAQQVQDRLPQWLVMAGRSVLLADINTDAFAGPGDLHHQ